MKISAPFLQATLLAMQQAGLQTKPLLSAAGLTQAELDDPDQRFSAEVLAAVWQEAMAASNNPSLGLLVGAKMDVGLLGIVGQLVRNAPTLKGAIEQLLAYYRLAADVFLFEITPVPEGVKLVFCFPPQATKLAPSLRRQLLLQEFALIRRGIEQLLQHPLTPLYLECEYGQAWRQSLGEAFGCPVRTAQRVNAVVLDHFVWQEKVKNADYRLLQPLEGVARQLLSASESNARFARKVQAIIVQHLDGRVPGIEPVARQLALSPRTLQRRLKAENTSFHQVSAQARLQLAERYLEEGLPMGEVAYLLGFSLPNAFSRWFKSRKGVTPLTYRRQIKSGISP